MLSPLDLTRAIAGGAFLTWFGAVIYGVWRLTRPLPRPETWTSKYGQVDPNTDEYRRLIMQ